MRMEFMLSENIKRYKEANKLNNRELAKLFNISPVIICNILNHGYSGVRVDTVNRIAKHMNISVDCLLYEKVNFKLRRKVDEYNKKM